MESEEFKTILSKAILGDKESAEVLLKFYEPMITRFSYINGKVDQDLKQYLMLHIVNNIAKFDLSFKNFY